MGIKSIALAVITLVLSTSVNAATILFQDDFSGYGNTLNAPPPGWVDFSITGGVDSSATSWWQNSGNTTGSSPDGDQNYVRSYTVGGEGLAISLEGFNIGQEYTISFYNAASVAFSGGDSYWDVYIDGSVIGSSATASITTLAWEVNALTFTATNTFHQIGFRGKTGINALLDSVVVSTVPVPAAVWLFGSGLIGLIGVARRKCK